MREDYSKRWSVTDQGPLSPKVAPFHPQCPSSPLTANSQRKHAIALSEAYRLLTELLEAAREGVSVAHALSGASGATAPHIEEAPSSRGGPCGAEHSPAGSVPHSFRGGALRSYVSLFPSSARTPVAHSGRTPETRARGTLEAHPRCTQVVDVGPHQGPASELLRKGKHRVALVFIELQAFTTASSAESAPEVGAPSVRRVPRERAPSAFPKRVPGVRRRSA